MRTLFLYIFCLQAVFGQLVQAQTLPVTKAQPEYPSLPYQIQYTKNPANGSVQLTIPNGSTPSSPVAIEPNGAVYSGTVVTLVTTPAPGYKASLGYPKLYRSGSTPQEAVIYTTKDGVRTFVMPAFPVTLEMAYEALPSGEARLKSLSYQVEGGGTSVPLPNFNSNTLTYNIVLPTGTSGTVTLTGQRLDGKTEEKASVTLSPGASSSATLTVTAQDGTTKTYTVRFTVAPPDSYIVTILSGLTGGTIAATKADGTPVKSGEAVVSGTVLTLSNTPVAGYKLDKYTVASGSTLPGSTLTVEAAVTISAEFTPPATVLPEIGVPAVPETSSEVPKPEKDAPIVIIPDANALPSDTELSELRLIKEQPTQENKTKVEELAKESSVPPANMEIMEIALVKVTTVVNAIDQTETTTVTPVQPNDVVKVRIPYPSGKNQAKYNFKIFHLKSDGTTEIYTTANGLKLEDTYMELTLSSFSPFGIAWETKSGPNPTPDPNPTPGPTPTPPTYYTVTLPSVEGVALSESAGRYSVKEEDDFTFSLTLQEGYQLYSKPEVRLSRNNEMIVPRVSDGKYVIKEVDRDIVVSITGILKDTGHPSSNTAIAERHRVWVADRILHVAAGYPTNLSVYTISGILKQRLNIPAGESQFSLSPGIYLVLVERTVTRIWVE